LLCLAAACRSSPTITFLCLAASCRSSPTNYHFAVPCW
jgi:hypothetical protein